MTFNFEVIAENWWYLLRGVLTTIELAAMTAVLATALGTLLALLRVYGPRYLSRVIAFYVDSMRGLPVLVVLVWGYFAFPLVAGIDLPAFWAALVALTVHGSAYMTEIARAGITSIRGGQMRACLSLGMSRVQAIRKVILPQSAIRILPSYGSMLAIIVKDSAVASVIAVPEFLYRSTVVAAQSYKSIEVFSFAMLVFFLIIFPLTRSVDFLYKRVVHLGRS